VKGKERKGKEGKGREGKGRKRKGKNRRKRKNAGTSIEWLTHEIGTWLCAMYVSACSKGI